MVSFNPDLSFREAPVILPRVLPNPIFKQEVIDLEAISNVYNNNVTCESSESAPGFESYTYIPTVPKKKKSNEKPIVRTPQTAKEMRRLQSIESSSIYRRRKKEQWTNLSNELVVAQRKIVSLQNELNQKQTEIDCLKNQILMLGQPVAQAVTNNLNIYNPTMNFNSLNAFPIQPIPQAAPVLVSKPTNDPWDSVDLDNL